MTPLQAYLNSPRARRALSKKPGQEGFSLIELVVVVAVLAILSAIAIPSFTSINNKARSSAAANTVATVAKECAVKYANGETAPTRPVVTPDAYGSVAVTQFDTGRTATTGCTSSGIISATPSVAGTLPTFSYNVETGAKTCTAGLIGCSSAGGW
tara:strand:+ start:73 stop:537 length:465 start_codon:yes stop_codon:yes gene_type:complete